MCQSYWRPWRSIITWAPLLKVTVTFLKNRKGNMLPLQILELNQIEPTVGWADFWYIWLVEWTIRSTQDRWNIKIVWTVFTNIKWKIKSFIMNLKKIYIKNKKLFILFLKNVYSSFNTYFYGNVLKLKKNWEMIYFLINMYLKILSSHSTNCIGKHF